MKNFITRALSGAVYVALIVCSILFGGAWAFPALCSIFAFIGIIEFQKMTQTDFYKSPRSLFVDLLIGISLPIVVATYNIFLTNLLLICFVLVMVALRFVMELYCHRTNAVRHIAMSMMSLVYVAVPLAMTAAIYCYGGRAGVSLSLLMFVMIWLNDTGAFLVGSAIGSHRLFERLSPKKSWEGFFGGMAFCIVAGVVAARFLPQFFAPLTELQLGAYGAVVSVMATWGDLFESMVKRTAGVKDSGNIIPGHGGILDRIDSLLFVGPTTLILYLIYSLLSSTMLLHGAM